MTREEHLTWAKQRAIELCDVGDVSQAIASMASDLLKHEETKGHAGIELMMLMTFGGHLKTAAETRKFIEGFS